MYKILLVDDDPDFIASTRTVLKSRPDYEVLAASDAVFALSTAKTQKPDLIILDVIMPFEDGFTTARELKDDPELSEIPIIILTNFSRRMGDTNISVAQGMELEAEDYLEKPDTPEELLQRVERVLKKQR